MPAAKKKATASKANFSTRDFAVAGLGVYGKLFDEIQDRVETFRKQAPKQFDGLVKRGEKAQQDLQKAQQELKNRIEGFDIAEQFDLNELRDQIEEMAERVREALNPAKA